MTIVCVPRVFEPNHQIRLLRPQTSDDLKSSQKSEVNDQRKSLGSRYAILIFLKNRLRRRWRGEIQVPEDDRDKISLDDVSKFELPALVVRGENSNILAPEAAELFREALPQGQLVTVPKCGHNVHSQNTLGFIDAVGEFLASLE